MKNSLLDNVICTFFSGNLAEDIMALLSETRYINGTTNTEQWHDFLNIIADWQTEYQIKSETMALYGYITWTLDISIHTFSFITPLQLKPLLLKALLISHFHDTTQMQFKAQSNIRDRLELELFDYLEFYSCSEITKRMLIDDMTRFHQGSNARLQNHKVKYAQHVELNRKLDAADLKFRKYIASLEQHNTSEQIVRINQLGECENGNTGCSELSLYFILTEQTLSLLAFSDFA